MAKRIFFSFHYADVITFRANVVRNSWVTKEDREDAGFFDASLWESSRRKGDDSLKRLINEGLDNTSATVVLIGSSTYSRRWVRYEIIKSIERGNRIFGIHINGIKDKNGYTYTNGVNPFDYLAIKYNSDGSALEFYEYENSKWQLYTDLAGYSLKTPRSRDEWGQSYKLTRWYSTYDWVADNGYNNFSNWVN